MKNYCQYEETDRVKESILPIILVLDSSGSMSEESSDQLNISIQGINQILQDFGKNNPHQQMNIGILEINTKARWQNPRGLELFEDFVYEDLKPGGLSNIGDALEELDKRLSCDQGGFLKSVSGFYKPIIIFFTDGRSTDPWRKPLEKLNQNWWYKKAIKIGFELEKANTSVIEEIVGSPEAVISLENLLTFRDMLRAIPIKVDMLHKDNIQNKIFEVGDIIPCLNSNAEIIQLISEGGQGIIYKVKYKNDLKAFKWYKTKYLGTDSKQIFDNIKNWINIYEVTNGELFNIPEDITEYSEEGFGYVMKIISDTYTPFEKFIEENILDKATTSIDKQVLCVAENIVRVFKSIHDTGYRFYDYDVNSFVVQPSSGNILFTQIDNIGPIDNTLILKGLTRYLAPEIVSGKESDVYSDYWFLANVLFLLFTGARPYEGKRVLNKTIMDTTAIYGAQSHFIMDDVDHPEYGVDLVIQQHAISVWNQLPNYIKDLFVKSLGHESIENPSIRPDELQWEEGFAQYRKDIEDSDG